MLCQPESQNRVEIQCVKSAEVLFHLLQKVAKNSANVVANLKSVMEIANAIALALIVQHSVLASARI